MSSLLIAPAVRRHARRTADAVSALTGIAVDADEILTGRAAQLELSSNGRTSAGGATRLLPAADRWCAVTLSRPDDIEAIPALIESDTIGADPWPALADWTAGRRAADAVARARLLGLPAAILGETPPAAPRRCPLGRPSSPRALSDLLVVDLSSMWAGPLCGRLLVRAGAAVVKVETPARPDGTRAQTTAFFDWMNSGKLCYAADFENPADLAELLAAADVVIEGSRPAALARRGLGPHDMPARDGRVWVRVTGHGTDGAAADRVAFGDDAAVSGGLVGWADEGPVLHGDAIADPLTGLHAAVAVLESLRAGGGELIEISMAAITATYAALPDSADVAPTPLRLPAPSPRAAKLGADNAEVSRLIERRVTAC